MALRTFTDMEIEEAVVTFGHMLCSANSPSNAVMKIYLSSSVSYIEALSSSVTARIRKGKIKRVLGEEDINQVMSNTSFRNFKYKLDYKDEKYR